VQELAPDRIAFAPGSSPIDLVPVVRNEDPANYQRLVEGVWVIRRGAYHYLFYSGDNCCGPNAHYAAMVARSRNATGPFEILSSTPGGTGIPILARRGTWVAPGHNSVIEDDDGNHWLLYHAVDSRRPRSKASDDINSRRVMLLDRIVWRDDWPRIADDGPSDGAQTGPAIRPR
jgi:arabinan endo-1,5-alpha-L-arabinosidase